jgi:hypothetical protein
MLGRRLSKEGDRVARYKGYDYSQGKFIPLQFDKQILPGTYPIDPEIGQIHLARKTKGEHSVAPLLYHP